MANMSAHAAPQVSVVQAERMTARVFGHEVWGDACFHIAALKNVKNIWELAWCTQVRVRC